MIKGGQSRTPERLIEDAAVIGIIWGVTGTGVIVYVVTIVREWL